MPLSTVALTDLGSVTELHYVIAALAAAPAAALLNLAALASYPGPDRTEAAICPTNALALALTLALDLGPERAAAIEATAVMPYECPSPSPNPSPSPSPSPSPNPDPDPNANP